MNKFVFANNIKTTVGSAFSNVSTTLTLSSSTGLPTLTAGEMFPITLNDAATGLIYEICYATAISGANLTVLRAQEGTTAQNWSVGDYAFSAPTAQSVAPQDWQWQTAGVPSGALNGSNMTYTLPHTPAYTVPVFINGLYAVVGTDYTISGATITKLGAALTSTESINYGDYRY